MKLETHCISLFVVKFQVMCHFLWKKNQKIKIRVHKNWLLCLSDFAIFFYELFSIHLTEVAGEGGPHLAPKIFIVPKV